MNRTASLFVVPVTFLSMIGVTAFAAYAALPTSPGAALSANPGGQASPAAKVFTLAQNDAPAPTYGAPAVQYAYQAPSAPIAPEPNGTPVSPAYGATPALLSPPAASDSVSQIADTKLLLAEIDCTRDDRKAKNALTLEQLEALMQHVIQTSGQSASVELMHELLQAALDRSHDDPALKTRAVNLLLAAYSAEAKPHLALAEAFNLVDTGAGFPNGYDPCGNPTAIGAGSAFAPGPFSTNFSTINPIPIVASKSGTTVEARPSI